MLPGNFTHQQDTKPGRVCPTVLTFHILMGVHTTRMEASERGTNSMTPQRENDSARQTGLTARKVRFEEQSAKCRSAFRGFSENRNDLFLVVCFFFSSKELTENPFDQRTPVFHLKRGLNENHNEKSSFTSLALLRIS